MVAQDAALEVELQDDQPHLLHRGPYGKDLGEQRNYSLRTEAIIDEEIDAEIDRGLKQAHKSIEENMPALERIAAYLLEHETIEAHEIEAIVEGNPVPPRPTGKSVTKAPVVEDESSDEPTPDEPDISTPKLEGA